MESNVDYFITHYFISSTGEVIGLRDGESFCEKHYWFIDKDHPCDSCDFESSGLIFEINMIKQAAIKDSAGKIWTLPRPARHCDILHYMYESNAGEATLDDQGFLLDDGSWVNRKQAAEHALKVGQCSKLIAPPDLYSEDLW